MLNTYIKYMNQLVQCQIGGILALLIPWSIRNSMQRMDRVGIRSLELLFATWDLPFHSREAWLIINMKPSCNWSIRKLLLPTVNPLLTRTAWFVD